MARLRVGTSGFVYPHWRGVFYPRDLPPSRWLDYYTSVFSTVELNAPFYRLPAHEAVDRWREETPKGFGFAAKGSRFITHMKRIDDVREPLQRYFDGVGRLRKKLEVVLWQLPPQMKWPDPERLHRFLGLLPRRVRHVVEFRSAAWYTDEVCAVLERHGAAFCEHDLVPRSPPSLTGGFRYLRFHGAGAPYGGRYGRPGLRGAAESLSAWHAAGKDAFVYFNNDLHGHAVLDALELLELLGRPARFEAPGPELPA